MKKLLALLLIPSLAFAQPLPGASVNIGKYGGTSTTLGQKAEAASIPVALATEQDAIETWVDDFSSTRNLMVCGGVADNLSSLPIPLITGGTAVSVSQIGASTITGTPGISDSGLFTRSLIYGYDSGSPINAPIKVNAAGVLAIQDNGGSITVDGTVAATQSGTWNIGTVTTLPALPANQSVNVAQINGVAATMGNGASGTGVQRVTIANDSTGVVGLSAGSNTIGKVDLSTPDTTSGWLVEYQASLTSTGTSTSSTRKIGGWACSNSNTSTAGYVKIYDKSSAATSSDTPIIKIGLPPGGGSNQEFARGIPITNGLSIRATTAVADSSTASPTATNVFCSILYR